MSVPKLLQRLQVPEIVCEHGADHTSVLVRAIGEEFHAPGPRTAPVKGPKFFIETFG